MRSQLTAAASVLAICLASCGFAPEPSIGSVEQAYQHGTPPGPAPWPYLLTSYGGADDDSAHGEVVACGERVADGRWYYATGAHTFGCGARLRLAVEDRCVVVEVADNGPAGWVEERAAERCGGAGYIIDASPLVSEHLFGTKSAGWSDCFAISVTQVSRDTPTGPCEADQAPQLARWIGGSCAADAECASGECFGDVDGFPGGMCTLPCDRLCPDRDGEPVTFCVDSLTDAAPAAAGSCVSRCDFERFPQRGCREHYRCVTMPRRAQPAVSRDVCLPQAKVDALPAARAEDELGGCAVALAATRTASHGGPLGPTLLLLALVLLRRHR